MKVYDNPEYYEIAFSFRDIPKEVDFIEQVIKKYSLIPVKSFLELASGNSPHMQELCRRGYSYIGLELNDEMVAFSRKNISLLRLSAAEIIKGNMVKFAVPSVVDCAVNFLGSFYVTSDDELKSHLDSVAKALRKGGLYVLDAAVSFFPEDVRSQSWEISKGNIKVTTTYQLRWIDESQRLSGAEIILDVDDAGVTKIMKHTEIRKIYSVDEFRKFVEVTEQWEFIDSFSDFDINKKPYEKSRNIVTLRRK